MKEAKASMLAVPVNEQDHVMGSMKPLVTVVTYGDYECPDCSRRHHTVEKAFDKVLNSVRFVYRHFPLVQVHPRALRAAEAAEAAAAQDKFWEMHRLLYSHSNRLSDADLRWYARRIGLNLERFDREMASGTYADQISEDYYNSIINGITGTPTSFINDVLCPKSDVELLAAVIKIIKDSSPDQ